MSDVARILRAWAYATDNKNLFLMLTGGRTIKQYISFLTREAEKEIREDTKTLNAELEKPVHVIRDKEPWSKKYQNDFLIKDLRRWIRNEKTYLRRLRQWPKSAQ